MRAAERRTAQVEALYRDSGPAVLAYLARRTTSEQAADLFSEVILTLWRRRDDVPPPGEDRLWLFGIARNTLANHHRQTTRHLHGTESLAAHLRAVTAEPLDVDLALDLHAALDNLPAQDREIILLTHWEHFTSAEVGSILDVPAGTVRTRLRRIRERLRLDLDLDDNGIDQTPPGGPLSPSRPPGTDDRAPSTC